MSQADRTRPLPDRGGPADRDTGPSNTPALQLSPVQVVASAAATICAAVVTSFTGVAGTVIGAGVTSVIATVGSAVYSYWIATGHRRLRQGLPRVAGASRRGSPQVRPPRPDPSDRTQPLPRPAGQRRGPAGPRRPTRRGLALLAAPFVVFGIALGAITAFESAAGAPISKVVIGERGGGTSLGHVVTGDTGSSGDTRTPSTPGTDGSGRGGSSGSPPSPTASPTPYATTRSAEPSPTPTPRPSPSAVTPSGLPTPAPTQVVPTGPATQTPRAPQPTGAPTGGGGTGDGTTGGGKTP